MARFIQQPVSAPNYYTCTDQFSLELLNIGKFDADDGCYSPSDISEAQRLFNANCGPAAFGAVCRLQVREAMPFFPQFPSRGWTTVGDMRNALQAAGTHFVDARHSLPEYGLALLQLRVNDRPLHPLYSLAHTHWVGVCNGSFYDVNWGGWLPISLWQRIVLSQVTFGRRQICGWAVRNSLVIRDEKLLQAAFGLPKTTAVSLLAAVCTADEVCRMKQGENRTPFDAQERPLSNAPGCAWNRCSDLT
jgi:hypothetical protein